MQATAKIKFDDVIEFPNGEGFTPCTKDYARIVDEMDAIKPDYVNLDDLSPEDYERWNRLDSELSQLQMEGHLGQSVRYYPLTKVGVRS